MSDTPPPPPAVMAEVNLNYETPPQHGNAPMLLRLAGIFGLVSSAIDLVYGVGMIVFACFMYYTITAAPGGGAFFVAGGPGAVPAPVAPGAPGAPPAPLAPAAPVGPEIAPGAGAPAPAVPGVPAAAPPGAAPAMPPPVAPAPLPPAFISYLFLGMYGGPGILSLLVVTPKVIGAVKLLRLRKRAWGWGLAGGIAGCTEVWMVMGCCPLLVIAMGAGIYTIVILCLPHVRVYVAAQQAANSVLKPAR